MVAVQALAPGPLDVELVDERGMQAADGRAVGAAKAAGAARVAVEHAVADDVQMVEQGLDVVAVA